MQLCRLPPDQRADPEQWHEIPRKDPANEWRQFVPRQVQDQRNADWRNGQTLPRPQSNNKADKPPIDWEKKAEKYARVYLADERYQQTLADLLRLPIAAVTTFPRIGVVTYPDGTAFTFPEQDGCRQVIGILRRFPNGDKVAIAGSSRGLILPKSWKDGTEPIFIVEGPSDTIAMTHAGLRCVGRPSAMGGAEKLAVLLKDWPSDQPIVIVGDNDERPAKADPSRMIWPGKDGMEAVANALASRLNRVVLMSLPPEDSKDVRDWLTQQDRDDTSWPERGILLRDALMTNTQSVGGKGKSSADWSPPIPLTQSLDGVPTFPIKTLPTWMRDFAEALATELQVPIDLPALLVLGVAGAGIARKVIVEPRSGWDEPTNLFVMVCCCQAIGRAKPSAKSWNRSSSWNANLTRQ